MKKTPIIIVIVVALILVFGIVSIYNNLNTLEENVDSSWSQVENVLKRRADLIPNLVNTVKGYANYEKEVLTSITEARSKFESANTPGEYAEADGQLRAAVTKLYAVAENYPDLKASKNFSDFQYELSGTENRIATERRRYNEAVQSYNSTIRKFPTNIVAKLFGFEKKAYFEIDAKDAEVPDVNF